MEGNPFPFYAKGDLTGSRDGVTCYEITTENALRYGWAAVRALRLLSRLPFVPA